MSRLDRYIFFKFIGNFGLFLGLIMMIAVAFDVSQKLDDFFNQGVSFSTIIKDYYFHFIAFYGSTFSGLIVFLSTIFFTARMASNTEIAAILTSGVSYRRFLRPYFFGALVVFLFFGFLGHFIIPSTNAKRIDFEDKYVQDQVSPTRPIHIHRQILPGHHIYVETWSPERLGGYHFTYETFEASLLKQKLSADFIRFDTLAKKWKIENWSHRVFHSDGTQSYEQGMRKDSLFTFLPESFTPNIKSTTTMTSPNLWTFIQQEKVSGSEAINSYLMEWHRRFSNPFAIFVLVLIAVTISAEKRRGGIGSKIALGLLLVIVYIFTMQLSGAFVTSQYIPPWLAVWMPNLLFAALGGYLYLRAAK